ncbi:MAG: MerC domain-containing protein [Wenzhouxiangella sp.]|nr:MerC domain-containing protein [Wenzhouxiangella sp.]MCH8477214.1 MerC domain-containing protein [Wenzhouxiangella sp.]TVR95256.1 MAG: MerC domain-containing protein [Wenzhouxiangellaceae bacterium]
MLGMAAVIEPKSRDRKGVILDRLAICVSGLCLVQCLLLPLLVVLTPLISLGIFGEEIFHMVLLGLIMPVSLAAFFLGYRVHRNRQMLVPGLTGLLIVILAAVFEHDMTALGTALLTSLGGALLIFGHWLNLRRRREACLAPQR